MDTELNALRSGDFVAGPFAYDNDIWNQGYGKLGWHPSEMTPKPPLLIVQATRLDQEAESRVYEASDIAWPSGPTESEATSIKFYPTGIRLPSVGRWMMVATAGNNWGCFILPIRRLFILAGPHCGEVRPTPRLLPTGPRASADALRYD